MDGTSKEAPRGLGSLSGLSGALSGAPGVMARRSSSDGAVMAYLAKAVESRVTEYETLMHATN